MKAKIIKDLIKDCEENVIKGELLEKFYQRELLKGQHKQQLEMLIGKLQADIKLNKNLVAFYKEQSKTE